MSVASISDAITCLLENSELRSALIERGLRRSACFSTAAFAAKILDVYQSLLSSTPNRAAS
jgi:glycosyltransferase involved in cell wall biosynthesis